jgi:hypothetical protein
MLGLILAANITARPIDDWNSSSDQQTDQPGTTSYIDPFPTRGPILPTPTTQSAAATSYVDPFPTIGPILPTPAPPAPQPAPSNSYVDPFPTIGPILPTPTPTPTPTPATQSCTTVNHGFWCAYSILIRVPYIGPSDCDATYNALEWSAGAEVSNWQCVKEDGYIRLWFNGDGDVGDINSALESRYPSVNRFNCHCNCC